jgi:hypothetical protein
MPVLRCYVQRRVTVQINGTEVTAMQRQSNEGSCVPVSRRRVCCGLAKGIAHIHIEAQGQEFLYGACAEILASQFLRM